MSQRYKAANAKDLILRELDEMSLIFHKTSGITHVVADPIPAILEVMEATSMTAAKVVDKLAKNFELEDALDIENFVLARLDEMCSLGLVELEAG